MFLRKQSRATEKNFRLATLSTLSAQARSMIFGIFVHGSSMQGIYHTVYSFARGEWITAVTMASKSPLSLTSRLFSQCPKCHSSLFRPPPRRPSPTSRTFMTSRSVSASIAAPEIDFENLPPPNPANARVVPVSPSYFTAKPEFTDNLLDLRALLRKYQTLPIVAPGQAPRVAWKTIPQYRLMVGENVRASKYHKIVEVLHRLNQIYPSLVPQPLKDAIEPYKRDVNPYANVRKPGTIDADGRAYGVGRRKSSSAKVFLVQGGGEVLVNGKSINSVFGRVHDRESALWALKATGRIDKYNVWALATGGGSTGQAEAITLGLANALMVHEPMLKPALRRGKPSVPCCDSVREKRYSRLTCTCSWLCGTRYSTGREEKGWQAEG